MIVRGPSLQLRYLVPEDAPALFELARDPEVTRFFSWGPYTDPAQPEEWVAAQEGRRERGEHLEFVVVSRDLGPIGVTGLLEPSRRDRRAVLGTWFGREHWGSGANAESKALMARLAFERLGLERLTAMAATENVRSQAALERLGFHREGVLEAWHRHSERVYDLVVYRFMRTDWESSPLRDVPVEVRGELPAAFVAG